MVYTLFYFVSICMGSQLLVLAPEKTAYLPVRSFEKVEVNSSAYLRIKDLGNKLKITGKKIGTSSLRIKDKEYQVEVVTNATYSTYQKLQKWLIDKRGLSINLKRKIIIITGEFLRFSDWLELETLMDEEDEFVIEAKASQDIESKIRQNLTQRLQENHLTLSSFQMRPRWSIAYSRNDKTQEQDLKKILPRLGISLFSSKDAITSVPLIEVKILAIEVKRTEIKNLGISWPSSTQFDLLPQAKLNPEVLSLTVNHLEQNGDLKIHASPTLISQSGEEATFHSGGEFPVKNMNQFNANVVWKKYGILLKILPKADFNGKMDIKIECEVSTMAEHVVEGVPALLMNRISSHFNLEGSRTIALSGLIKKEWNQSRGGLPGLMHIPLLQQLFSSESYKQDQSELIFLVTPRIAK